MSYPQRGVARAAFTSAVLCGLLSVTGLAHAVDLASPLPLPAVAVTKVGPYQVTATCNVALISSTNTSQLTYTIDGTASSSSTNGATPLATFVGCSLSKVNGPGKADTPLGSFGNGLPGPVAVAAGQITAGLHDTVRLCATGSALFTDGGAPAASNCSVL